MTQRITWIGLAALVLTAAGCHSVTEKNRQADTLAKTVLTLLDVQKTDAIYEHYATADFRQNNSRAKLRKLSEALHASVGSLQGHSLRRSDVTITSNGTRGKYVYHVRWDKAEGALLLSLVWKNGAWKIQAMDVESTAVPEKPSTRPAPSNPTVHI